MTETKTKYPAIAILLADGTLWHQVTSRKHAELIDQDEMGQITSIKRAMPQALAICKQYGWLAGGVRMYQPGVSGLAIIEAED